MKIRNLVIALSTAVLLPNLAFADSDTDAISASFDRILDYKAAVEYVPAKKVDADPLVNAIVDAIYSAKSS